MCEATFKFLWRTAWPHQLRDVLDYAKYERIAAPRRAPRWTFWRSATAVTSHIFIGLQALEESQQLIIRAVLCESGIGQSGFGHDFLLQLEVGFQKYLSGLHRFMAKP